MVLANVFRHYLLAGSGVNAENIQSELQSIKFYQNQEPAEFSTFESETVEVRPFYCIDDLC